MEQINTIANCGNYDSILISEKENAKSGKQDLDLNVRKLNNIHLNPQPLSLEQFHADITRSLDDSENDRMIKATDLKAKVIKWT